MVAVSNGTVIIGAPDHAATRGAAYVFAGSTLALQAELTATSPIVAGNFGSAVAIDSDRIIIGEIGNSSAYAYSRFGSKWKLHGTFNDATATRFGGSVGISGNRVIVGAMDDGTAGMAYVLTDDTIFADDYEK